MRRAARPDDNHTEVSKAFARLGWSVLDIHQLPNCADIVVGKNDRNIIIEIKDGEKAPSRQKLTPGEQKFHDRWNGELRIVTCIQDVIDLDAEHRKIILASR